MFKTRPGRRPPKDPADDFHAFHYIRHTCRRLEHLATLATCGGLDLSNKSVLEVGAGIGDHTTFFLDRECRVLATDAREENVSRLERVFKNEPRVQARVLDLDRVDGTMSVPAFGSAGAANSAGGGGVGGFEIIYCYGTLYHLSRPEPAIDFMARQCGASGVLLMETSVAFGRDESLNPVEEDARWHSQAASGRGCRPTRPWVYSRLAKHFEHVYMPRTQPNHPEFPLDWTASPQAGPGSRNPAAHARAVFIATRSPMDSPVLERGIPMVQKRH